jgi:hypothetical protein
VEGIEEIHDQDQGDLSTLRGGGDMSNGDSGWRREIDFPDDGVEEMDLEEGEEEVMDPYDMLTVQENEEDGRNIFDRFWDFADDHIAVQIPIIVATVFAGFALLFFILTRAFPPGAVDGDTYKKEKSSWMKRNSDLQDKLTQSNYELSVSGRKLDDLQHQYDNDMKWARTHHVWGFRNLEIRDFDLPKGVSIQTQGDTVKVFGNNDREHPWVGTDGNALMGLTISDSLIGFSCEEAESWHKKDREKKLPVFGGSSTQSNQLKSIYSGDIPTMHPGSKENWK